MQNDKSSNRLFYQNNSNSQNSILEVNDVVKVKNRNYSIVFMNDENIVGVDMYGNQLEFTKDDIQKITFKDNKQLKITITPIDEKIQQLEKSLKSLTRKLNFNSNTLSKIKCLKILANAIREEIKTLKPSKQYKQLELI